MSVFGQYASFYDTLYEEKNYEAECTFIETVLKRDARTPIRTILDLGCGTGGHLLPLASRGYDVAGVDRSAEMLAQARRKGEEAGFPLALHQGDVRDLDLGQPFDAVISMFAVMSYQCTNQDLLDAFGTARRHLEPGGLFVFDLWFGPAVLRDPPTDRYRIIEQGEERVVRFAHPELDLLTQLVTVHYRVWHFRGSTLLSEVEESHPMRFLFPQELYHLLASAGFETIEVCPIFELGKPPSAQTWTISVIARAR